MILTPNKIWGPPPLAPLRAFLYIFLLFFQKYSLDMTYEGLEEIFAGGGDERTVKRA